MNDRARSCSARARLRRILEQAGGLDSEEIKERILEEVRRLRGRRGAARRHDARGAEGRGGGKPCERRACAQPARAGAASRPTLRRPAAARSCPHPREPRQREPRPRRGRQRAARVPGRRGARDAGHRAAAPARPRTAPRAARAGAGPRSSRPRTWRATPRTSACRSCCAWAAARRRPAAARRRPCGRTPARRSSPALYLDGGFEAAHRFVRDEFAQDLEDSDEPLEDPKSALQERLQAKGRPLPRYNVIAEEGPSHRRRFRVECRARRRHGHGRRGLLQEGGPAEGRAAGARGLRCRRSAPRPRSSRRRGRRSPS